MTTERQRIAEEAAQWAVQLESGPLPEDKARSLDSWLAEDPGRLGALVRARAVACRVERLAAIGGTAERTRERGAVAHAPGMRRWAIAAGLAAILSVGALWLVNRGGVESYRSEIGELRKLILSDGTSMVLSSATLAKVEFGGGRREIELTRGEAHFDVARDPGRPFVVRAGNLAVTALGTAFAIRNDSERVDVTVTEGVVEVARSDGSSELVAPRRVSANHQAVSAGSRALEVRPIAEREAQRKLAWLDGMVVFEGEALAEAVAEVNRYCRTQIVVRDAVLASRPLVGIFRATDSAAFATTAATALGVEAVRDGDVIYLQVRADP
jgi:transmembrane sensor